MQTLTPLLKAKAAILTQIEQNAYIYYVDAAGLLHQYNVQTAHNQLVVDSSTWLILDENISLYAYKNYVAVVNSRQVYGFVYDVVADETALFMKRGDYQVEHCSFPLAFLDIDGQSCCLHGTDWNRLDIFNLETKTYITDRETEKYDFDYFHSLLAVSPDQQNFVVNGWHWSPYDAIYQFKVSEFMENYELANQIVGDYERSGYNWDRPLCWVDNQAVALIFSDRESGEGDELNPKAYILLANIANEETPQTTVEILDADFVRTFLLNKEGEAQGKLFYNAQKDHFVISTNLIRWAIINRAGQVIFHSGTKELDQFFLVDYLPELNMCLLETRQNEFSLFQPAI
jgi:hypothetical protein